MAGGGGGKTSTQTGQNQSQFSPELMNLYRLSLPTIRALSGQTTSALQTGGVNANIPSINASVASARESFSRSQEMLRQQLATSGLSGSQFAQEILGGNQMQSGENISQIPTSITNDFLSRGVPTVVGTGTSALSTAAGLNTSSTQQFTPSFWSMFLQGLQSAGQIGAEAGAAAA